jgi:YgiT-type zinc finger domain-containing protein
MDDVLPQIALCPRCNLAMQAAMVRTVIWQGDQMFVVENIPAQVCNSCMEQYYDDNVTDALRRLTEDNFPAAEAKREVTVPIFSLEERIKTRVAPIDYEQY